MLIARSCRKKSKSGRARLNWQATDDLNVDVAYFKTDQEVTGSLISKNIKPSPLFFFIGAVPGGTEDNRVSDTESPSYVEGGSHVAVCDSDQATGHNSMSIDERIVDILSKDARIGNREVARQLDISESQVRGRLKRLQDEKRIHIGLMLDAVGAAEFHVISYIRLTIEPIGMNEALKPLLASANVTSMYYVSGSYNVLLIVGFGSLAEMGDFTSRYLRSDLGVLEVSIEQITGCLKHRYELISMQD